MLNPQDQKDQEKIVKACQTSNLLVQDLRELVKSDDPLLSDIALELLQQGVQIENRLKRIEAVSKP